MLLTLIFLIADLLQLCLYPMPNNKPHLPVLKGQHTRCNSHYIFNWRRCNLNHIQQSFSEYIYSHVHCRLKSYKLYYVSFWVYCMVTEGFLKLYSFLCSWMGGIWPFHFFVFHVKIVILSLDSIHDDGGMFTSHTISTWMLHTACEQTLLVVLHASIAIFLQCIKCVYVHRSHGNAFSCNMCCLSFLQCVSYVVVMFSRLILKD